MAKPDSQAALTRARLIAGGAVLLLALMALMHLIGAPRPPPAPPRPDQAALTALSMADFAVDPAACRAALTGAGFVIAPAPDRREGQGCGYRDAIWLKGSLHGYSEPLVASCAAVAAMAVWERDVLEPAAQKRFGQRVASIELAGPAYSCRAIAGRADGRMSEHARANAVDVKGFTLEDGRAVSVEAGWRGADDERAFLRDLRDGACGVFQVVLSPDYNADHRDHLHLDMGRWRVCR
jgi:hypothetical protein